MSNVDQTVRPDLATGVAAREVAKDGMLLGRVGDDEVLLVRAGEEFFAVGAHCTHYHGALVDGIVVGDTVRCPLHHASTEWDPAQAHEAPPRFAS